MAIITKNKGIKETFSKFFEDPSRETLRTLLQENFGETDYLDFKEQWPSYPKLAKQILGIGNTCPGCIVVGVKENDDKTFEPTGLNALTDKADIHNGIKHFLPTELISRVAIYDFYYEASEYPKLVGKKFQVIFVEYKTDHTPFVSTKAGEGIRAATVYVRRSGGVGEATHDELQKLINKRIESGYSTSSELDIKKHFEQLRVLYSEIPMFVPGFGLMRTDLMSLLGQPNPKAPQESFEEFVGAMIVAKKTLIASIIGVLFNANEARARRKA